MLIKNLKAVGLGTLLACAIVIISRPGLAQEDESEARRKPGPVNVARAWTGTVDDSVDGAGTLDLDFSQKQAVVGGTWQYQTGGHDVTGTVAGKATADSLSFTMKSGKPNNCNIKVTVSTLTATEMSGSYLGKTKHCQASGTFDVTKSQ
ncbi:MAG TPA: hypothetical protein VMH37_06100 [Candidatus Binataceae bacterium]|nr:hypothetical protein [Candidatus Binataceae bacterium]